MDFVHDNLADGRAIRILSIFDLWDRRWLSLSAEFCQTLQGVVNILESLKVRGKLPHKLRTDNGPEFTGKIVKAWAEKDGITIEYTRPGKPADNGHIESFNGRFRDECLNLHIFESLCDAKEKIENWREDYNFTRPHSGLGWLAPVACKEKYINNELDTNLKLV